MNKMDTDIEHSSEERISLFNYQNRDQSNVPTLMCEDNLMSSASHSDVGNHDDVMDETHLSVNVKFSRALEDSGVFSIGSSDSFGKDSIKRHSSPEDDADNLKYIHESPDTPYETEIVRDALFGAFHSTPLSVSTGRSPKYRKCRKYSRDIFYKRRTSGEDVLRPYKSSLIGQESLDFLAYLGEHACLQPALDSILNFLDPEDLCRATVVSQCWKNIIENVPSSRNRKKVFLAQRSQIKENLHQLGKKSDNGDTLPLRGQLVSIQNFNRAVDVNQNSSRSPPVSPSKVRFNLFLKEGQKLEYGQALLQCPQCKLPSHRKSNFSALCTRQGCQYYFCTQCLCKFHGEKPCPVSIKHRKRQVAIGSRESRRNLQRLCH